MERFPGRVYQWIAWLAISIALALYMLYFPVNLKNLANDGNVSAAYPAVSGLVSVEGFADYLLVVRYLAGLFLLFTAGVLSARKGSSPLPLVAAIFLAGFGPVIGFQGDTWQPPFTPALRQIIELSNLGLVFAVFLSLFHLGHLYPDNRYPIRWLKYIVPWLNFAVLGWFALLFSGVMDRFGDFAWTIMMALILAAFTLALFSAFWRLRSKRSFPGRNGVVGLVTVMLLIVLSTMFSDAFSPALKLASLHLDLVLPVFLAAAFLSDYYNSELWDLDARPSTRTLFITGAGILAAAVLIVGLTAQQLNAGERLASEQVEEILKREFTPLIVDTDMGNDDVLALLFLMEHPGVEFSALTVVGTGLAHCAPGMRNALGLLELADSPDVPVSCGTEIPIGAEREFPSSWRASTDRLWGLGLSTGGRQTDLRQAPELIAGILREAETPVTILALGPLTNFAEVFQSEPDLIGKVEMLYFIGGAVYVPGNVYDENLGLYNRTAEWNVYADPVAARMVFQSGVPITLVPLDATNYVPVDMGLFHQFEQQHGTRVSTFVFNIFYINQGWIQTGFYYLWDTLTAAALVAPEVVTYDQIDLMVVTESGPDYGRTAVAAEGSPVRVAVRADKELFEALFVRVLRGP